MGSGVAVLLLANEATCLIPSLVDYLLQQELDRSLKEPSEVLS